MSEENEGVPVAKVWVIEVPRTGYQVRPAVLKAPSLLEGFVKGRNAFVVINGGFFDPVTGETASFMMKDGEMVLDPTTNHRLVDNPDLAPYLPMIMNRSEFRTYQCGEETRYDIAFHNDVIPTGCELCDALGAGPMLLPAFTGEAEGFVAYRQGKVIRDAVGAFRPNARSAVGIKKDGAVLIVMVAQDFSATPKMTGLSLQELAEQMKALGAEKALALDGGSSTALWLKSPEPTAHYGRQKGKGDVVKRKVKSVLLVQPLAD